MHEYKDDEWIYGIVSVGTPISYSCHFERNSMARPTLPVEHNDDDDDNDDEGDEDYDNNDANDNENNDDDGDDDGGGDDNSSNDDDDCNRVGT